MLKREKGRDATFSKRLATRRCRPASGSSTCQPTVTPGSSPFRHYSFSCTYPLLLFDHENSMLNRQNSFTLSPFLPFLVLFRYTLALSFLDFTVPQNSSVPDAGNERVVRFSPRRFRGTFDLLLSSLTTLLLCAWTAYHSNVRNDQSKWKKLQRRAKWTMIAIFVPEFVSLCLAPVVGFANAERADKQNQRYRLQRRAQYNRDQRHKL